MVAGLPLIYLMISGNLLKALVAVTPGRGLRTGGLPGILLLVIVVVGAWRLGYDIKKKKFIADLDRHQEGDIAN